MGLDLYPRLIVPVGHEVGLTRHPALVDSKESADVIVA